MSEMLVMDPTGHTRHIWDRSNAAEVQAMRELYANLTGKGYRAFRVRENGDEGNRMETFDPDAEKMIMLPQLRGG